MCQRIDLPGDLVNRPRRHAAASGLTATGIALAASTSPRTVDGPANLLLLSPEEIDAIMLD